MERRQMSEDVRTTDKIIRSEERSMETCGAAWVDAWMGGEYAVHVHSYVIMLHPHITVLKEENARLMALLSGKGVDVHL